MIKNSGIHYSLLIRRRQLVSYLILIVIGIGLPLAVLLAIKFSVSPSKEFMLLKGKFPTCAIENCVFLAYSPNTYDANISAELFLEKLKFHHPELKSFSTKSFIDKTALFSYILDNRGSAALAIDFDDINGWTVYSKDKQQNLLPSDLQFAKSSLATIEMVFAEMQTGRSSQEAPQFSVVDSSEFSADQMQGQCLSILALSFTIIGLSQMSFLAKLKDKRFYEYMVVSGLDRVKFWLGVALVLFIETTVICLVLLIMIASLKIIPGNFSYTITPMLMLIVPASCCNVLWIIFSIVVVNKQQSAAVIFILPTILGQQLFMLISILMQQQTKRIVPIILGFVLLFVPATAPTSMLSSMGTATIKMSFSNVSLWGFVNTKSAASLSIIETFFISLASLVCYSFVTYLLEFCNPKATHPTIPIKNLFARMKARLNRNFEGELLDNELSLTVQNVSMTFRKGCAKQGKCCKLSETKALKDFSVTLSHSKSVVGVVAQNGGGKTTLFKCLLGSIHPEHGRILLNQTSPQNADHFHFRQMAVVFQENQLIQDVYVLEYIKLMANFMGVDIYDIDKLVKRMGLEKSLNQKCQQLSGGQQRRLNILVSMLRTNPALIILDEPACGVDIQSRKYLWNYIRTKQDCLVLLTTHIMEEAEELCDEVIIMKEGKLVAHGSLPFVKRSLAQGYALNIPNVKQIDEELRLQQLEQQIVGKIDQIYNAANPVILSFNERGARIMIPFLYQDKLPDIIQMAQQLYPQLRVLSPTLTETFLRVCEEQYDHVFVERD